MKWSDERSNALMPCSASRPVEVARSDLTNRNMQLHGSTHDRCDLRPIGTCHQDLCDNPGGKRFRHGVDSVPRRGPVGHVGLTRSGRRLITRWTHAPDQASGHVSIDGVPVASRTVDADGGAPLDPSSSATRASKTSTFSCRHRTTSRTGSGKSTL